MAGTVSPDESTQLAGAAEAATRVEDHLAQFLTRRPLPSNLREAIEYAVLSGGKRLRPMLTLAAARLTGYEGTRHARLAACVEFIHTATLLHDDVVDEAALPAAGAIELIHCFSLVHDDLPAMDDDDLRRGRPTLHRHTNEAMAILAGDAMSALAFELVATGFDDAEMVGRITRELAVATNDMIAGQVYDTLPDFPADIDPLERLRTIHKNKTGALIRASCRMGAIVGRASDEQLDALTRYGEAMGLMFQVIDDLLDVTQTTEHLGKTAGKDAVQGKMTYPGLLGVDETRQEAGRLRSIALESLQSLSTAGEPLRALCEYFAVRTR